VSKQNLNKPSEQKRDEFELVEAKQEMANMKEYYEKQFDMAQGER